MQERGKVTINESDLRGGDGSGDRLYHVLGTVCVTAAEEDL